VLRAPPVAGAVARHEQLVLNAVPSGNKGSYAASGRRPGRSGLLVYRFALSQVARPSGQLAGSQNYYVLRPYVGGTTPRVDAFIGNGKAVLSPCRTCFSGICAIAVAFGRLGARHNIRNDLYI